MCRFKSGIILKNKVEIAPEENDSHSDLLRNLGIKDDYIGATKTFVRAELVPKDNKWWISPEENPSEWIFIVDQDITPDWFCRETYEPIFRTAVCEWWQKHVLIDQKIDELNGGYYRLKRCEVKKLYNDVRVLLSDSQVGEMYGSSQVGEMYGSSQVGKMYDSSQVGKMWASSTARDFKQYPLIKICVSENGNFEMMVHRNK